MSALPRLTLVTAIVGLLIAGCAHQPASQTRTSVPTSTTRHAAHTQLEHATAGNADTDTDEAGLPQHTGIAACDDYLASYMACHRTAQIFTADQLPARYQAMRTSLLRDSQNPDIRPQLAARCNSLATQLRQALHGKPCGAAPAPVGGKP